MHRTRSRERSGALRLRSCRLKGLGRVFGNKNGSGYQSSFPLLSLLVLCSFPWKPLQVRERRAVLRSSPQSSRERGPSCRSSAMSLCTSRPPASCAQTRCHLPSVRSRPRSAVGTGLRRGTFGDKTAKTWSASGPARAGRQRPGSTRSADSAGQRHSARSTPAPAPAFTDAPLDVQGCVSRRAGCQEGSQPPESQGGHLRASSGWHLWAAVEYWGPLPISGADL